MEKYITRISNLQDKGYEIKLEFMPAETIPKYHVRILGNGRLGMGYSDSSMQEAFDQAYEDAK